MVIRGRALRPSPGRKRVVTMKDSPRTPAPAEENGLPGSPWPPRFRYREPFPSQERRDWASGREVYAGEGSKEITAFPKGGVFHRDEIGGWGGFERKAGGLPRSGCVGPGP